MADAAGDEAVRAALAAYPVPSPVREEMVAYARLHFAPDERVASATFPLPDEPFVAAWTAYAAEAEQVGAWPALRRRLVQLRFPVAAGMGDTPEYRAATRRGVFPERGEGVSLRDPDGVTLRLHPTPAGRIPVVVAAERADFVTLVRAFTRRNEPDPVPDSMGACIVGGYNNWDRVHALRRAWEREHPGAPDGGWQEHFRTLIPRRELYQDRFILLSSGGYSATSAADLGLDEDAWRRTSLVIRLEHECAHYFTRRVLGSMRNALHDELLADYAGIRLAAGSFRKDWFLRFMGLERFPAFRAGGRLENYRGDPPLSDAAFDLLQAIVVRAADELALLDRDVTDFGDPVVRARVLTRLASVSLPELALPGAAARLAEAEFRAGVPG